VKDLLGLKKNTANAIVDSLAGLAANRRDGLKGALLLYRRALPTIQKLKEAEAEIKRQESLVKRRARDAAAKREARKTAREMIQLEESAFERYKTYKMSGKLADEISHKNLFQSRKETDVINKSVPDPRHVNSLHDKDIDAYINKVTKIIKPTITRALRKNAMSRIFITMEFLLYDKVKYEIQKRGGYHSVVSEDIYLMTAESPVASGFIFFHGGKTTELSMEHPDAKLVFGQKRFLKDPEEYVKQSQIENAALLKYSGKKDNYPSHFLDTNSFDKFINFFEVCLKEMLDRLEQIYGPSAVFSLGEQKIHILKYNPLSGGSYAPLPPAVKNSKAVINIKNTDNKCFLYSCVASRFRAERDPERVTKYLPYLDDFKYSEADFPMKLDGIPRFERNNNVRINVYTWDSGQKVPLLLSRYKSEEIINLFYYNDHYSLIRNFQRFVGGDHRWVCERCLKCYRNKESFESHVSICSELNSNGSLVTLPKDGSKTKFNAYKKQKKLPIVIYADFESSLIEGNSVRKNGIETEKSYVTAEHKPNSYRIRVQSDLDLPFPVDYTHSGEDAAVHFIGQIMALDKQTNQFLNKLNEQNAKPKLTQEEEIMFEEATKCYLCGNGFNEIKKNPGDTVPPFGKCRDHDHFTNDFLGAAHNVCNIKAEQMRKGRIEVPVFFHNANYDIRCFINAFSEYEGGSIDRLGGIPCNMEFFKTLNLNNLVIKDSYAHLSSSLDTLIKNLPHEKKTLLNTIGTTEKQKALVQKKGHYPYEFITSHAKIDMPISELKREHFDNKLTLSSISDEDWAHVQTVISEFGFKSFREYHDLYLKIDVYGLVDVFEEYRAIAYRTYGLDPAHYIGLPGFTWDAGLKMTGIQLENMQDMEMILMTEKMKRGGVSVISGRYAKANNPYLPDYNKNEKSSYLIQLDCNNLYGKAMCAKLPVSDFKWVDAENYDLKQYDPEGDYGAILDVDLDYPEELHDLHNDYPLAPEHLTINGGGKLAPNLLDKTNYIIYIDNLLYYLKKGMILKKIHRVFTFKRKEWLRGYIEKNSLLRQQAKNDFEKDFFKLMNNAFYGKTMENERDRVNVQFCQNAKQFEKHTCSPLFAGQILVINKDTLALVKTHKKIVKLAKPIYTGAVILEISKLIMYEFHYDTMMVAYPEAKMLKTDTDSLLYHIETEDLYKDFASNPLIQKSIEFSNYPKDHPLYNTDRKKVPGLFQDECVDGTFVIISEYVGLRAKSYSNKLHIPETGGYVDKKKSKGVPSLHVKKRLNFEDYHTCLVTGENKKLDNLTNFRSFGLRTYTIMQEKIALSAADDKRVIRSDGIRTYAYGHKDAKTENVIMQRGIIPTSKSSKEKMDEIFPPEEDHLLDI